tara:strand:- start:595 stop:732 length:138 start_codon:yes stop_codon:yes gene_type:complete
MAISTSYKGGTIGKPKFHTIRANTHNKYFILVFVNLIISIILLVY